MKFFSQLYHFTYQQALSCLFPVAIFLALALSTVIEIPFLYRYDFILLVCLAVQVLMYYSGMESKDELKVIAVFHVIGLALEIYKVHMGSWSYPEESLTKIFGVPLYSGFMYASVASYICQAWKRLDLKLVGWPASYWTIPLGAAIYLNFFTHHFLYDIRWVLTVLLFVLFFRSFVYFRLKEAVYRMPLVLSFILIGFFIWIAENITTFFGAWQYPNQEGTWELVHIGKISSWFLLIIVSFIIVAQLKHVKYDLRKPKYSTESE
ncbi:hypothetical protein AJ85_17485 [Alkalihalobacillus alcalophilus ATCC 27647 = CGMCC 1.3604]|uniref:DUF817 domain-containing protein n=1 Tax=Alkalihalobacillus alcalophilus ATCC 27647 = CGMCC 1.3604 TaxID=1218173 RepID=A0A094YRK4_ALKAL|nr:DUF817 domain-containing protein [Alkalihalobacillus alcalophilus]KGA96127.1 hypothetical protein BALCAV_0218230 [Alkalihalobacillus alcalophilus ATCC 27647 = CGMCC 1.3604]MED1564318.1 DUF817 domain-containing protein [Alkalihalobacillus alcalophilus]THG92079.1 hypothetical protein AJ85_17485 [Alkalihalobacillus alcalophilus ATCC 27647 = CGMCC 1.3604]